MPKEIEKETLNSIYALHEYEMMDIDIERKELNDGFNKKSLSKDQYYACLQLKYDELSFQLENVNEELKNTRQQLQEERSKNTNLKNLLEKENKKNKHLEPLQESDRI